MIEITLFAAAVVILGWLIADLRKKCLKMAVVFFFATIAVLCGCGLIGVGASRYLAGDRDPTPAPARGEGGAWWQTVVGGALVLAAAVRIGVAEAHRKDCDAEKPPI